MKIVQRVIAIGLLALNLGCWDKDTAIDANQKEVKVIQAFRLTFRMPIDHFYKKILVVDQTGLCVLTLQSNVEYPDFPLIAKFFTKIEPEAAKKLYEHVYGLKDAAIPDQGDLPPGVPMFDVLLEAGTQRLYRRFDPHVVPKRFQVIGRQLREIEQEALKNVVAGVRAYFDIQTQTIDREQPFAAKLRLSAIGAEQVEFINPLNPPPNGFGAITLNGVRSDVPDEALQTIHRKAVTIGDHELKSKPESMQENKLYLGPEGANAIDLEFSVILDWPPGNYNVSLNVESSGPIDSDNMLIGRIIVPPQPLSVTGAQKPEDAGNMYYKPPEF